MQSGEELALIDASNSDWWRVLTRNGVEGYVPANYCEMAPEDEKVGEEEFSYSDQQKVISFYVIRPSNY